MKTESGTIIMLFGFLVLFITLVFVGFNNSDIGENTPVSEKDKIKLVAHKKIEVQHDISEMNLSDFKIKTDNKTGSVS